MGRDCSRVTTQIPRCLTADGLGRSMIDHPCNAGQAPLPHLLTEGSTAVLQDHLPKQLQTGFQLPRLSDPGAHSLYLSIHRIISNMFLYYETTPAMSRAVTFMPFRRHWVQSTRMKGVTLHDAPGRQITSLQRAVNLDGLQRISRASRIEPASRRL